MCLSFVFEIACANESDSVMDGKSHEVTSPQNLSARGTYGFWKFLKSSVVYNETHICAKKNAYFYKNVSILYLYNLAWSKFI